MLRGISDHKRVDVWKYRTNNQQMAVGCAWSYLRNMTRLLLERQVRLNSSFPFLLYTHFTYNLARIECASTIFTTSTSSALAWLRFPSRALGFERCITMQGLREAVSAWKTCTLSMNMFPNISLCCTSRYAKPCKFGVPINYG